MRSNLVFIFQNRHFLFIGGDSLVDVVISVALQHTLNYSDGLLLLLLLTSLALLGVASFFSSLLVLLANRFIDHVSLVFQTRHSVNEVVEFEMRPSFRALEGLASIGVFGLIFVVLSVVEHVDADEVYHRCVHLLSLAQLEGQVLVFFFLL